jgi:hypothetical protein
MGCPKSLKLTWDWCSFSVPLLASTKVCDSSNRVEAGKPLVRCRRVPAFGTGVRSLGVSLSPCDSAPLSSSKIPTFGACAT